MGHLGRCVCYSGAEVVDFSDTIVIPLAAEIPEGCFGWFDIGLIAAVHDHIVRALFRTQMLAAEVPTYIHEFDGIERTAAFPRRTGCVRALAVKAVLGEKQTGAAGTIDGAEIARNVRA